MHKQLILVTGRLSWWIVNVEINFIWYAILFQLYPFQWRIWWNWSFVNTWQQPVAWKIIIWFGYSGTQSNYFLSWYSTIKWNRTPSMKVDPIYLRNRQPLGFKPRTNLFIQEPNGGFPQLIFSLLVECFWKTWTWTCAIMSVLRSHRPCYYFCVVFLYQNNCTRHYYYYYYSSSAKKFGSHSPRHNTLHNLQS